VLVSLDKNVVGIKATSKKKGRQNVKREQKVRGQAKDRIKSLKMYNEHKRRKIGTQNRREVHTHTASHTEAIEPFGAEDLVDEGLEETLVDLVVHTSSIDRECE
jgi:hypothetical protein